LVQEDMQIHSAIS